VGKSAERLKLKIRYKALKNTGNITLHISFKISPLGSKAWPCGITYASLPKLDEIIECGPILCGSLIPMRVVGCDNLGASVNLCVDQPACCPKYAIVFDTSRMDGGLFYLWNRDISLNIVFIPFNIPNLHFFFVFSIYKTQCDVQPVPGSSLLFCQLNSGEMAVLTIVFLTITMPHPSFSIVGS